MSREENYIIPLLSILLSLVTPIGISGCTRCSERAPREGGNRHAVHVQNRLA